MRIRVSASRLELLSNGRVRLALKTTWRNGVTHVTMPQADLILRMCAQIPLPRRPSLRYHGVFAPAARLRSKIVPAGDQARCRRNQARPPEFPRPPILDANLGARRRATEAYSCTPQGASRRSNDELRQKRWIGDKNLAEGCGARHRRVWRGARR